MKNAVSVSGREAAQPNMSSSTNDKNGRLPINNSARIGLRIRVAVFAACAVFWAIVLYYAFT